ncbi:MAG: hypothetical protein IH989_08180 [Planctomycetes bacterium]|nr:hypothetical protein [Planctomycetota bacterium]
MGAIIVSTLGTFAQEQHPIKLTDCGFQPRDVVLQAIADAVAAGEIPDPTKKVLPLVQARANPGGAAGVVHAFHEFISSRRHLFDPRDRRGLYHGPDAGFLPAPLRGDAALG